jgi:hypothetical protein
MPYNTMVRITGVDASVFNPIAVLAIAINAFASADTIAITTIGSRAMIGLRKMSSSNRMMTITAPRLISSPLDSCWSSVSSWTAASPPIRTCRPVPSVSVLDSLRSLRTASATALSP